MWMVPMGSGRLLWAALSLTLALSPLRSHSLSCNSTSEYQGPEEESCLPCRTCNSETEFATRLCNGITDTECAALTSCNPSSYEHAAPTLTSNRDCRLCSTCSIAVKLACATSSDTICISSDHRITLLFAEADFSALFGPPNSKNETAVQLFTQHLKNALETRGVDVDPIFKVDVAEGSVLAHIHADSLTTVNTIKAALASGGPLLITLSPSMTLEGSVHESEEGSDGSSLSTLAVALIAAGSVVGGILLVVVLVVLLVRRLRTSQTSSSETRVFPQVASSHPPKKRGKDSTGDSTVQTGSSSLRGNGHNTSSGSKLADRRPSTGSELTTSSSVGRSLGNRRMSRSKGSSSALSKRSDSSTGLESQDLSVDGGYLEVGFDVELLHPPGTVNPAMAKRVLSTFDTDAIQAVYGEGDETSGLADEFAGDDASSSVGAQSERSSRNYTDYDLTIRRPSLPSGEGLHNSAGNENSSANNSNVNRRTSSNLRRKPEGELVSSSAANVNNSRPAITLDRATRGSSFSDTVFGFGFDDDSKDSEPSELSREPSVLDKRVQMTFSPPRQTSSSDSAASSTSPSRATAPSHPMLRRLKEEDDDSPSSRGQGALRDSTTSPRNSRAGSIYVAPLEETVEVKRLQGSMLVDVDVDHAFNMAPGSDSSLKKAPTKKDLDDTEEYLGFGSESEPASSPEPNSDSLPPVDALSVVALIQEAMRALGTALLQGSRTAQCLSRLRHLVSDSLLSPSSSPANNQVVPQCLQAGLVPSLLHALDTSPLGSTADEICLLLAGLARDPQAAEAIVRGDLVPLVRVLQSGSPSVLDTLAAAAAHSPQLRSSMLDAHVLGAVLGLLTSSGPSLNSTPSAFRHAAVSLLADLVLGAYPRPSWLLVEPSFLNLLSLIGDQDTLVCILACRCVAQLVSEFYLALTKVPDTVMATLVPLIRNSDEGKVVLDLVHVLSAGRVHSRALFDLHGPVVIADLIAQDHVSEAVLVVALKVLQRLCADFPSQTTELLRPRAPFMAKLDALKHREEEGPVRRFATELLDKLQGTSSLTRRSSFDLFDKAVTAAAANPRKRTTSRESQEDTLLEQRQQEEEEEAGAAMRNAWKWKNKSEQDLSRDRRDLD